jgi:hypothetical protein
MHLGTVISYAPGDSYQLFTWGQLSAMHVGTVISYEPGDNYQLCTWGQLSVMHLETVIIYAPLSHYRLIHRPRYLEERFILILFSIPNLSFGMIFPSHKVCTCSITLYSPALSSGRPAVLFVCCSERIMRLFVRNVIKLMKTYQPEGQELR